MNTQLEKLFEENKFSAKDKYEINQFFELLPDFKKINFLKNFDTFTIRIRNIQKDIDVERRILVWEALIDIDKILKIIKK